jgi:S1-C subfamily serine protease
MPKSVVIRIILVFFLHLFITAGNINDAIATPLTQTIAALKPAVVAIGTLQRSRSPAIKFFATGFVVGDGLSVITNAHAIPELLDSEHMEQLGIVTSRINQPDFRPAQVVAIDREHDLVHLRLSGTPLPALKLGKSAGVEEGQAMAFTGFPLGMAMGLHHVTHLATVSAITPVVLPTLNTSQLDVRVRSQLQKAPFDIFQLDGTAYPGNSGSPLYDPQTGLVYGVINMVLLKGLKENALSNPSGISYAVPSAFVEALLQAGPAPK